MPPEHASGTTDAEHERRIESTEDATPEAIREVEATLSLTASVADLLPEELVRRYGGGDEYPDGKVWELWPAFECRACRKGSISVNYECEPMTKRDEDDEDELGIQFTWDEMRPVCQRCGSGLTNRTVERHRPARWKQPLIHGMVAVQGLSNRHEPLFEAFDHDPVRFVRSTADELAEVEGIGKAFARTLVVKNHHHYPEVAPEPDAEWEQTKEHERWHSQFS